ncbi:MAG: succinyl-diaminopimelate desuccinylase [Pseudomonadota bacterium]
MHADALIDLTMELIRRPSVTPADAGCLELLGGLLADCGFALRRVDRGGVSNLWATRGSGGPLVAFAGHTDVVPPGDLAAWDSDPFAPEIRAGLLYGRGAADMKSSLAAMVGAAAELDADHPGTLALLLTSDEEGDATDGTVAVLDALAADGVRIDYCIVGEPSSSERLGDVVRNGRRGSLNGKARITGVQGHVAYPEQVSNPIHASAEVLTRLLAIDWDHGNDYFPATSFQVSNVRAGTGATNVVPGIWEADFNLRFNTEQTAPGIQARIAQALTDVEADWHIDYRLSGEPFLTPRGRLTDVVSACIERHCGYAPALSTSGGTSDGRFIAPTGAHVVELGPRNATIHKINECVAVNELQPLQSIYRDSVAALLGAADAD